MTPPHQKKWRHKKCFYNFTRLLKNQKKSRNTRVTLCCWVNIYKKTKNNYVAFISKYSISIKKYFLRYWVKTQGTINREYRQELEGVNNKSLIFTHIKQFIFISEIAFWYKCKYLVRFLPVILKPSCSLICKVTCFTCWCLFFIV